MKTLLGRWRASIGLVLAAAVMLCYAASEPARAAPQVWPSDALPNALSSGLGLASTAHGQARAQLVVRLSVTPSCSVLAADARVRMVCDPRIGWLVHIVPLESDRFHALRFRSAPDQPGQSAEIPVAAGSAFRVNLDY